MTANDKSQGENSHKRSRRRRRRRPDTEPKTAAAVIATSKAVDTSVGADVPLTPTEAAQMRAHFRFLRAHRNILRLKLNANEDLLVNGVREPTHRGICQHLLAKVERPRVISALDRLSVIERTRLLEGVVRFSPDVTYILLYLKCVKDSATQAEAVAAVFQALRLIDFSTASSGQMRQVLDLLIEVFAARELPAVLLGLLDSASFRGAFDASAEELPAALANILVPLRAAHSYIIKGERERQEQAVRGALLLLKSSPKWLLAQTDAVRERLFETGVEASERQIEEYGPALRGLLDSFPTDDRKYTDYAMRLARRMLEANDSRPAQNLLQQVCAKAPNFKAAASLLAALGGRRFGSIAVSERIPERSEPPKAPLIALCLKSQRPVWLRFGDPDQRSQFEQTSELYRSTIIPSLAGLVEAGISRDREPYFAVLRLGQPLQGWLKERETLPLPQARSLCNEAVRILAALSMSRVQLPDARAYRFSVELASRLWLYDLWGAERGDAALEASLSQAKSLCRELLRRSASGIERQRLESELDTAADFRRLAALFQ